MNLTKNKKIVVTPLTATKYLSFLLFFRDIPTDKYGQTKERVLEIVPHRENLTAFSTDIGFFIRS